MLKSGDDYEGAHPGLVEACLAAQTPADIGLMVYTSGSTGKPKGAMLSYRNMRAQAAGVIERLGYDADTTNLSYLPLCHVAEQMLSTMAPIYVGSCVSFGESIRTVREDLREIAPTLFLGVPRIWEKLHAAIHIKLMEAERLAPTPVRGGPRRLRALRHQAAGGAPQPAREGGRRLLPSRHLPGAAELHRPAQGQGRAHRSGPDPAAHRAVLPHARCPARRGLWPHRDVRNVRRPAPPAPAAQFGGRGGCRRRAPLGAEGELLLRGDIALEGYFRNPEATAAVLRDGWLHTGDVAAIEDGQTRIVDRLKDIMITAGGKNLSPRRSRTR